MISVTECEEIISNLNENSKKTQIDNSDPWMYNFNTEVRSGYYLLFKYIFEFKGEICTGRNCGQNCRKESERMS